MWSYKLISVEASWHCMLPLIWQPIKLSSEKLQYAHFVHNPLKIMAMAKNHSRRQKSQYSWWSWLCDFLTAIGSPGPAEVTSPLLPEQSFTCLATLVGCKAYSTGYIPRWYILPTTVTHPSTNRARRRVALFICRTTLTTTRVRGLV